jgi:hypothetical protein
LRRAPDLLGRGASIAYGAGGDAKEMSRGFLYVASLSKCFYERALDSIISLKRCWPEANVCLFTHRRWADEDRARVGEYVDNLVTGIPAFIRTKLWALPRTPYDETCYIDADTYVVSEDIKYIFDQLPRDKHVVMTCNRPYNARVVYFTEDGMEGPDKAGRCLDQDDPADLELIRKGQAHQLKWHCGLFVYKNDETTKSLWRLWLSVLLKHYYGPDQSLGGASEAGTCGHTAPYPGELGFFDTFAFWRVLHENAAMRRIVARFPKPDARWQWVVGYREWELQGTEIVVLHNSVKESAMREGYLDDIEICNDFGNINVLR